jgi:tRNA-dihydrouridine synthase B
VAEVRALLHEHLLAHHAFYGDYLGVRTARKHIGWYVRELAGGEEFRQQMNRIEQCDAQLEALDAFWDLQLAHGERLQYRLFEERLAA